MAKLRKVSKQSVLSSPKRRAKYEKQFFKTEANLKRKGKTNKKHKNSKTK